MFPLHDRTVTDELIEKVSAWNCYPWTIPFYDYKGVMLFLLACAVYFLCDFTLFARGRHFVLSSVDRDHAFLSCRTEYFGEKITLYNVFIGHYSFWLIWPCIIGLVRPDLSTTTAVLFHTLTLPAHSPRACLCVYRFSSWWSGGRRTTPPRCCPSTRSSSPCGVSSCLSTGRGNTAGFESVFVLMSCCFYARVLNKSYCFRAGIQYVVVRCTRLFSECGLA